MRGGPRRVTMNLKGQSDRVGIRLIWLQIETWWDFVITVMNIRVT